MVGFIDPPDYMAPLAEWEKFLAQMELAEPRTEQIKQVIAEAKERVAAIKRRSA